MNPVIASSDGTVVDRMLREHASPTTSPATTRLIGRKLS